MNHISFKIVHAQNMVLGLNLYLSSQSICVVGFGFPTMSSPLLRNPVAHPCFCKPLPSFLTKSLPLF